MAKADVLAVADTVYSDDELAAIKPIAESKAPAPVPIDSATLRQALLGIAHMPTKDGGETGTKIMLRAYASRLGEFPAEAIFRACRHWLDHEKYFPGIADLRRLAKDYVSPEQSAINRARNIMRNGRRNRPKESGEITLACIEAMTPDIRAVGLKIGALVEIDGKVVVRQDD